MISNLRRVSDHLLHEADFDKAIQLVSLTACFSGAPSRLFIGSFDSDLRLSPVVGFGFNDGDGILDLFAQSLNREVLGEALYSESVVIQNHDRILVDRLRDLSGFQEDSKWKTTVWMPLLPDYFATLSTLFESKSSESDLEYFNALRSILNLYFKSHRRSLRIQSGRASNRKPTLNTSELTERQGLILELIEAGETNTEIADHIGYSESLIRKESMAIYRKIGVSGRRDLGITARQEDQRKEKRFLS